MLALHFRGKEQGPKEKHNKKGASHREQRTQMCVLLVQMSIDKAAARCMSSLCNW